MRVLLLNDGATPVGGAELQALRLRRLLADAGHDARLLASSASELRAPSQADVTCFGTTHARLRVLVQTANPTALRALRRELERFPPDVVHVRMFLTQLSPLVLTALRDVPVVWQVVFYKAICPRGTKVLPDGSRCTVRSGAVCLRNRCVTPQSWALDMLQQRLWRRWAGAIDAVVTLSGAMRRRLEANGIPVTEVIPNGVPERPPRPALSGAGTVAFAGRLVPEKGPDVLLRSFADVARERPGVRLLIAGDGPERPALQVLAERLGVADRTEFLGHLARARLERVLDDAWVQVVPGRWDEPLGNVTLEAMMRGTAVVASAAGGPAELLEDGATGLLVAPGSAPDLARALAALLDDPAACERLGAAARAVALERYGEARVVERFERLYARLAAENTADAEMDPAA